MGHPTLLTDPVAFQTAMLEWYRAHRRRLPWREEPSLYRTVVSEFMLQQTQVKTMLPYFARWLEALPDFAALAAADESRVVKLWEGLGYYTRARNLHKLARALVAMPAIPHDREAWLALPGVGPYASAAITSISFGTPAAVVDGNVVRILARLTADGTAFRDTTTAGKAFTPLADSLLNLAAPGDHNQAMMELGATVCTRHNPLCTVCPVRRFCAGARSGEPEAFPRLAAKRIEAVTTLRAWCVRPSAGEGSAQAELLLHRTATSARRLAGQHELPSAEHLGFAPAELAAAGPLLATRKRGITRFAFTEPIHALPARLLPRPLPAGLVWVPISELETVLLSGPHRRWVRELLAASPAPDA
ncbi:MAG: A/G-specific adenine glycosylase [Opitutaceae bacterium]|nr:A/G-specific adenine glycosylase [Opitutaceae bacterium]